MQKPGSKYPSSAGSFPSMAPGTLPDPSWNAVHFNEMIKNRGILFTHSKAIPCPNVQDVESMIHVNHCTHPDCWNGMLYVQPKKAWGYFNNDQLNKLFEVQGEYNENIAVITMSAVYEDGEECDLAPFDWLVADEYSKRVYELVESSPSGIDRLKYPALEVHTLRTHNREFIKDVDFTIDQGRIRWISNNRPSYNQSLNRGEVYTIGYYIRPSYYVHHVMKEVRASQLLESTGEKIAIRFPQHIMVTRTLLHPDSNDKVGDQTSKMPRTGIFPPR